MHTYRKLENNSCEIVLTIKQFYIREILRKGPKLIAVFIKAKIVQNMCFLPQQNIKRQFSSFHDILKKLNPFEEKISLSSYSQENFLCILNFFMLRVLYLVKEVRMS